MRSQPGHTGTYVGSQTVDDYILGDKHMPLSNFPLPVPMQDNPVSW